MIRRLQWWGIAAGVAVAIGSFGVGILPQSQNSLVARSAPALWLRVPTAGVLATAVLLLAGAAVLVGAWIRSGRVLLAWRRAGQERRALYWARRLFWVWSVPMMLAVPVFSADVLSYNAQGRLMAQGADPYTTWVSQMPGWFAEGSDLLWAQSASPYGPVFLMLAEGIYRIAGGIPEVSVFLFRLASLLGVWLTMTALIRLCRRYGQDPVWALWIVVLNPLWIFSMVTSAHNDSLMIGLALWAFVFALDGQPGPRTALLSLGAIALAIAVKPVVVIALPFLGLVLAGKRASWRRRIGWWAITAVCVGAVLAVFGGISGLWFGWIGAMVSQGSAALPLAPWGLAGMGLGALVSAFGAPGGVVQGAFYAAGKVIAVLAAVWLAVRRPDGQALRHVGIVLALSVFLAPVIQPWYLLWILPFFVAGTRFYGWWEDGVILASTFATVSTLVVILSIPEWVPKPVVYIVASAAGAVCLVLLCVLDRRNRAMFARLWPPTWRTVRPESVLLAKPAPVVPTRRREIT